MCVCVSLFLYSRMYAYTCIGRGFESDQSGGGYVRAHTGRTVSEMSRGQFNEVRGFGAWFMCVCETDRERE